MRYFAWADWVNKEPSRLRTYAPSVSLLSFDGQLSNSRCSLSCEFNWRGSYLGNIDWAHHYMRDDVRARVLMSLLPYRRALISVDQKSQKLLLALRVRRQTRTDIADRAYVLDTFHDLRPYISYALGGIVDPSTLSVEASFKPVVIRSYRAKTDFFQFSVKDAWAACDREAAHAA